MTHHQIPLFDRPTLNTTRMQKVTMNIVAAKSKLSREQIVDKMNDLADAYGINLVNRGKLKVATFEKWINQNDSRQMPMKALPVFCAAVRDISAMDILAQPVGATVIGPEDQNLLRWAKAYFKARDARQVMRSIETALPPGIRK